VFLWFKNIRIVGAGRMRIVDLSIRRPVTVFIFSVATAAYRKGHQEDSPRRRGLELNHEGTKTRRIHEVIFDLAVTDVDTLGDFDTRSEFFFVRTFVPLCLCGSKTFALLGQVA
jgi:hypothetical protein